MYFFMQVLFLIISYCCKLFTIDRFILEYFDYQIATNNIVNQCRLFVFEKRYGDFLCLETFR